MQKNEKAPDIKQIQWKSILLAFRPKTLTAALVPVLAASALAKAISNEFHAHYLWFALLASFCIQIGTNLINDAVDFKKGADTDKRIGPQRITQAGILSEKQVLVLGAGFFIAAVALGIPLVIGGGWPIVWIGLLSVAMGYAYTAGPFPLAYLGLGDLFVIIFFGIVAVMGMFFLQTGTWSIESMVLGLQIGLLAAILIAINNFRDAQGDSLVNKKTLAVRFGSTFSRIEISLFTILPFILNFFWWKRGFLLAAWLPFLCLPLAFKLIHSIYTNEPGPIYNKFLGLSAGLHLVFGLLLAIGFTA